MIDYAAARRSMVDSQLRTFDVNDRRLLAAFDAVPREVFLAPEQRALAYADCPHAVGEGGREMLRPLVLARLMQELDIRSGEKVLDVAGGSGYTAALARSIGAETVLLEDDPALIDLARGACQAAGAGEIALVRNALDEGAPSQAPFDVIIINGAVGGEPVRLLAQLRVGGRLGCILAEGRLKRATVYLKTAGGISRRFVFDAGAPLLAAFQPAPSFVF